MIKMYRKSTLTLVNGLLVNQDNEIIMVDPAIINEANELETLLQKFSYINDQPEAQPMPTLDGFRRKSISDKNDMFFVAKTPTLDEMAKRTMMMMDEIDGHNTAAEANKMLRQFSKLIDFVDSDTIVGMDGSELVKFDTPTLGSVLELTRKDVINVIATINGLTSDGEEVNEIDSRDFDSVDELLDHLGTILREVENNDEPREIDDEE